VFDITGPAAEVVMMGYANSEQITAGINQRLFARAYIFSSAGGRRVVFVSAELGQLFSSIKQGVIKKLAAKYGALYDDKNVQISATHTHAGPGGYSHYAMFNFTSYGFVPQNYNIIVDGIVNAITQAHDSIAPATISFGAADLTNASINRSNTAYAKNQNDPLRDVGPNPARLTNPVMSVLRIDRGSAPAGAISWFSVHNTSLTKNNKIISSDHKGYASYLFEKSQGTIQPFQSPRKFVAAFPNGDEGDQSPNINPGFRGPADPDDFKSMRIIGEREFTSAQSVFNRPGLEAVRGPVDFRHAWVKMPNLLVVSNFTNGAGQKTLCNASYGFSFAAGAEDGPSGAPGFTEGMTFTSKDAAGWNNLSNFFKGNLVPTHLRQGFKAVATTFNDECQKPKPVLVPAGVWGWFPETLPFQLLRVGSVVIAGIPGEMTVRAGSRLRNVLLQSFAGRGVTQVILTGLANEYSGYITTPEEYDSQQYEGASTMYGRLTFEAYVQIFGRLAGEMNGGVTNGVSDPPPPDLGANQISLQTGVIFDNTPVGETFGTVTIQPPPFVMQGGIVDVRFRGGHPKNDLMTNGSYYYIQRQTTGGTWADAVWDSMPEGRYTWKRDDRLSCKACSNIDIHWDVPSDATPGTYRIKHVGAWKHSSTGAIARYEGITQTFEVRGRGFNSITPCGGLGQRGCCTTERQSGLLGKACTGELEEKGTCTGDCTCGGNNLNGATKSIGMCTAKPAAPVISACGGVNQRGCCVSERGGITKPACQRDSFEVPGCSGNCLCGSNPNNEKSSGTCIAAAPCGGENQRACCVDERGGLFVPACKPGLLPRGKCAGGNACVCGGDNSGGVIRTAELCVK